MKEKFLVELNFGDIKYSVRATIHAQERMEQRGVEEFAVVGNVLALGKNRMIDLQARQDEAIIIDEKNEISIVVGFKKNTLKIITVIGTKDIWNNRGTKIENI